MTYVPTKVALLWILFCEDFRSTLDNARFLTDIKPIRREAMQTGAASSDERCAPESPSATPSVLGMIKEERTTLRAIDRIFKREPAAATDYHVRATCAAMEGAMLDIREMEQELEIFAKDHVISRETAAADDYHVRATCAAMEAAMLDIRQMEQELENSGPVLPKDRKGYSKAFVWRWRSYRGKRWIWVVPRNKRHGEPSPQPTGYIYEDPEQQDALSPEVGSRRGVKRGPSSAASLLEAKVARRDAGC